jgi:hypothetical protein
MIAWIKPAVPSGLGKIIYFHETGNQSVAYAIQYVVLWHASMIP